MDIITFLKENYLNIISNLFGLIGVVLAIYFYYKSRKVKKPFYAIISFNLINEKIRNIGNIQIKYSDEIINNLTVSKIAIWNGGKETIDSSGIPESSKLKIKAEDKIVIYDAQFIYKSEESNQLIITHLKDKNTLIIDFEYLDFNQGGIIKTIHSGESSNDLIISGKIKGVGNYKEVKDDPEDRAPIILLIIVVFIFFSGILIVKSVIGKVIFLFFVVMTLISLILNLKGPKIPEKIINKFYD